MRRRKSSPNRLDCVSAPYGVVQSSETPPALRSQAQRELARAEDAVASIEIEAGGEAVKAVDVDGVAADVRAPVRVEPGSHQLDVNMPSGVMVHRSVTLEPRERLRLSIDRTHEIVIVPERERLGADAAPASGTSTTAASGHRIRPLWFFVAAGATGVLGAVTIWSALDTRSAYDTYRNRLSTASQAELDERVASGHDKETRTNVLLAVTGVAAVGTAVLGIFAVDFGPGSQTALVVGPGSAAVRGRF